jgi:arylsulfatase A-like enzyme
MKKLFIGLTSALLCASAVAAAKPNIVFILVDDLGYGDVGFNGSTYFETPNIDKLAGEGLVLDRAYMYPTCSPSRTALATGKQSFRTGVYTVPVLEKGDDQENIFSRWTVGEEHIMYSQPLADAGYKAIHLGKWHLVGPDPEFEANATFPLKEKLTQPDPWDVSWVPYHKEHCKKYYPEGRGYLKNIGGTYRGDPALEVGGYKGVTGGYFAPFSNPFLPEKNPKDKWLTDYLTTEAIAFMDEYKDGPFFINLHYYTVHAPVRARSEKLLKKYMDKPGDPVLGQGMATDKRREHEAGYATMIESLDDNVGRIMDFLEQNGLRENTVIVFTSDNGYNKGQSHNDKLHGYKGMIYEGGIRVPAFVNWPGNVTARRTDTPITAVDYFPTFMSLAGIHYTGPLDGQSFTPLFTAENEDLQKRSIYWHVASGWRHGPVSVISRDNLKLIQFLADGSAELYDLKADPKEEHNLAAEKPELLTQLVKELTTWRKANHVPLPPNAPMEF